MRSLFTLEQMITPILQAMPETRDSDKELALQVWTKFYGVNPWAPIDEVLRNDCIPSIESIGRVRRKVQAECEGLRGSRAKEKTRLEAQADFIEYALAEGEKTDSYSGII